MLQILIAVLVSTMILLVAMQYLEAKGIKLINDYMRSGLRSKQSKSAQHESNRKVVSVPWVDDIKRKMQVLNMEQDVTIRKIALAEILVSLILLSIFKSAKILPAVIILCPIMTVIWIDRSSKNRVRDFENNFENGIQNILSSLHAGMNLVQAFDHLANSNISMVSETFQNIMSEYHVGMSLQSSVHNVLDSFESMSLQLFSQIIDIYYNSGGDITEILENMLIILRRKRSHQGDLLAKTAEVRMTANLLIALPMILMIYLSSFQKNMIEPLWIDPLGQIVFIVGIILWGIGIILVQRLTRIESIE